jgi:hypothetical protein
MSNAPIPVAGSLSAKLIRACTQHADCPLDCPAREVTELGTVASFDTRSFIQHLREALSWRHSSPP